MRNGVGVPQHIVLFGGTSEIGLAVIEGLIGPGVAHVTLVCRDIGAGEQAAASIGSINDDIHVEIVRFEATDAAAMIDVVAEICSSAGDIDVAVVAQGLLGQDADHFSGAETLVEVMSVNATATMSLLYALSARMRDQGYGRIVLLSSVAGQRPRRSNPVYGASKAAVDTFALALDHELEGSGVSVLVVRPGFVETRMTKGMKKAPFSTSPRGVAEAVVPAVNSQRRVVYAPRVLSAVFAVFRLLPEKVWRRLPLN
ncbi:MAG: SDR family NAD(P)-dependent oxidoreductase [Ilumatobacteraceae bacterium]